MFIAMIISFNTKLFFLQTVKCYCSCKAHPMTFGDYSKYSTESLSLFTVPLYHTQQMNKILESRKNLFVCIEI